MQIPVLKEALSVHVKQALAIHGCVMKPAAFPPWVQGGEADTLREQRYQGHRLWQRCVR